MRVAIVTIAYGSAEAVEGLLATARSTRHRVTGHLFLHSREPAVEAACARLAAQPGVRLYGYGTNRGVSRSWNEGVLAAYDDGADVVVVANDDLTFGEGDLDRLVERAAACRDRYIVTCAGYHLGYRRPLPSLGYACFAINPVAVERLGCFDENFFPAYCEDQDYARRAALAGLREENCPGTMIRHGGSATIFRNQALRQQNVLTHSRNAAYYCAKWGGPPHGERWRAPFGNPAYDYRIAPERRHAPYGQPYDRADHAIVRL